MAEASLDDLLEQLAEVEDQISETTGAVGFHIGSMTVDEKSSYDQLIQQRADLKLLIGNIRAGGTSTDNSSPASFSME